MSGSQKVTTSNVPEQKNAEQNRNIAPQMLVQDKSSVALNMQKKSTQLSRLVQRKIHFLDTGRELQKPSNKVEGKDFGKVSSALAANEFTKFMWGVYQKRFVLEKEFKEAITTALQSDNQTLLVNSLDDPTILNYASFVIQATENLGPNPDNFIVDKPSPGSIQIEPLKSRFSYKYVPEKTGKKTPGFVANIASYFAEGGVKNIANKYFDDAISGTEEVKTNRLAIVIGLNSFSSVIEEDYTKQSTSVETAVDGLQVPSYPINLRAFGFLWEPNWKFQGKSLKTPEIRYAIDRSNDFKDRRGEFKKVQKTLSENYPYGIFRETVTASPHTQDMVDRLKCYNDPVYLHSGDGDAIGLKVPNEDDTGLSDKGVLDQFSEHLTKNGTSAMLVIGGYNLYSLNQKALLKEIVKADTSITAYGDSKKKFERSIPSENLADYKPEDQIRLQQKIEQIEHNSQVGNRYDRIIRDAISGIYPKMLYPTEPNMLIKAYEAETTTKTGTNLFDKKDLFAAQGNLWGMGASEGRILKENLETTYGKTTGDGKGFVDWAKGASLPTDPRGFARHLLISGYEQFPKTKKEWPPFAKYEKTKEGAAIPLLDAAVQQAQSYTSAFRLATLYAQASESKDASRLTIDGARDVAKPAFDTVEVMVKSMMDGSADLSSLIVQSDVDTGSKQCDLIAKAIRQELLRKYKFYNGLKMD